MDNQTDHTPRPADEKHTHQEIGHEADDPIVHAPLKRILVPLDFSPPSRRALRFARDWAVRFGSEVCLLHVIEPMNTFGVLGAEAIMMPLSPFDFHEQARTELEKLAHQEFSDSTKVSVHVRDGAAYDQIATAARSCKRTSSLSPRTAAPDCRTSCWAAPPSASCATRRVPCSRSGER